VSVLIERDGADSSLFVAAMIFSGVGILATAKPGFALDGGDEVLRIAKRDTMRGSEVLSSFRDEHHVRTFFEDRAGGLNGIFHAAEARDGTGAKGGGVHDDRVAFDVAVEGEMGAEAGVKDWIVLENDDGSFDGVERVAAVFENSPAGLESAEAAGFTGFNSVIGNVPGAAVNYKRRVHRKAE
jgi:hypothetical protein